jgi:hypothetical protein
LVLQPRHSSFIASSNLLKSLLKSSIGQSSPLLSSPQKGDSLRLSNPCVRP